MSNELVVISKEEYDMLAGYNLLKETNTEGNVFWMRLGLLRHKTPVRSFKEAVEEKAFIKVLPDVDYRAYLDVVRELCSKISSEWLLVHDAYIRIANLQYDKCISNTRLEILLNDEVVCSNIVPEHLTGEKGYFAHLLITAVKNARSSGFKDGQNTSIKKITKMLSDTVLDN